MSYYDEIEIEDMTFDPTLQIYHYPCPCGDRFEICISDLRDGEDVAVCPSCSLMIQVIFDMVRSALECALAYSHPNWCHQESLPQEEPEVNEQSDQVAVIA
ncbi:zf-CSL-domain-containing protein [Eremomyces bilateralis CBS 781.70]|uniref:Diphthamide biosynthesis protein 3 n=1 Tax=Eremomyces bilateralis CBS 781.70 TaxID=1392243 RepID=A0A6G1FTQ9_9PEZI|nr:zf-CSL-domain-containing protein [Eremomyces bilateralis CBS 781.70]KAF1809106.1 zf-CSL-domain-containing protein [Eremomyces bilateralis CBS 781.70]